MTTSLFLLLLADVILAASGQLLLKKGMLILGPLDFALKSIPHLFNEAIRNGYIWIALVFYGVSLVLWLFVLSKLRLSIAYPSLSMVYILIILGSWIFFKEPITTFQITGTAFILIGIFLIFQVR